MFPFRRPAKIFYWAFWQLGLILNRVPKRSAPVAKRVCILRTDAIGDFVLFWPALSGLREKYGGARITLVVQDRLRALAELHPAVDDLLTFDPEHFGRNPLYRLRFLQHLRSRHFSLCLNPVYSRERLGDEMALWTAAPVKIGWDSANHFLSPAETRAGNGVYTRLLAPPAAETLHELKRHSLWLQELGLPGRELQAALPMAPQAESRIRDLWQAWGLNRSRVVALVPFGRKPDRQWPASNYAALVRKIRLVQKEIAFLILGAEGQDQTFFSQAGLGPRVVNLCGRTRLDDLPALFRRCCLAVGGDTGPMHMAQAVDLPTVCIMGGGHYGRFRPYGDPARHCCLTHALACFQCDWKCPFSERLCISRVSVDEVFEAVKFRLLLGGMVRRTPERQENKIL